GTLSDAAARAVAGSACSLKIFWTPIGAMAMGTGSFSPRTIVLVSLNSSVPSEFLCEGTNLLGTIDQRLNAARFFSYVDPRPQLPCRYPHELADRHFLARASHSFGWKLKSGRVEDVVPALKTDCS